MSVTRRSSIARLLAFGTALAIAFTQLALAGFACPMGGTPSAMRAAMEQGDCPQAPDAGSKTLCVKSCQGEPQKHDVPSLDVPSPPVAPALRIEMPATVLALAALPPPPDRNRPTGPPPHKQYERFLK